MRFWFIIMLGFVCTAGIITVQGDIRTIEPGGTVFIGEEQLDISAAGISPGSQIAWWAPGTSLDETPADTVTVSDPASFSALSSSFSGKEGVWYSLDDKAPVIKIKQPQMNIRISDTTSDFDATGKWLPRGHLASFQIGTNLYVLQNRPGVSGAPVDIIVQSPGGAQYSAVTGPTGSFSLTGIPVKSAMYDTGAIWNTGGTDSGTYSLHAECTANRMNSNNPGPGAAVSQTITVLIQDINPLISEAEKREKEEQSGQLTPAQTLTGAPTALPVSTPEQILVQPSASASVSQQTVSVTSAPSGSGSVKEPVQTMLPVITPISSSPSPSPRTSSPTDTPSTPLTGIITICALMCAAYRI